MRFEPVHCGQFANESEKTAFDKVSQQIQQLDGEGLFVILTNLQFSLAAHRVPDDLDMVVIGPSGLNVVEVKHWDANFLKQRAADVEYRATKLNEKVRRLATRVRKDFSNLEFITGKFFLTKASAVPEALRTVVGLKIYGLDEWRAMLEIGAWGRWNEAQVRAVAKRISSAASVALNPEISRIGPVSGLALVSDRSDRFHRVFRGEHSEQRDRVVLHLYDLSATNEKNPLERARRPCAVLQRYQKSASLPRLIDSFQELPEYPGVMYFFTHADDVAPSLAEVRSMTSWIFDQRLEFAIGALKALGDLHDSDDGEPLLHRGITPATLLVRADNRPLYAGWEWAKLPKSATISAGAQVSGHDQFVPPEVIREGLAVADRRSDVYSVCATLLAAFEGSDEEGAVQASGILNRGLTADPERRPLLGELATLLEAIPRTQEVTVAPPISRWSDNYEVKAFDAKYRVVSRLTGGVIGYAFKVVRIDPETGDDTETLVAKGADERERGQQMLTAYKLARAHSGRPGLSGVAQVASDWQADKPVALLNWVDGESLDYWSGDVSLIAEDVGELDSEPLLLGWLSELCAGLGRFHAAGLIHGDVSPGNIIVNRAAVALTDYDLVTEVGKTAAGRGTPPYSSLRLRRGEIVAPRDDLYALAATFFYALTKRDPFMYDGIYHEERGLAWRPGEKESFPKLSEFLDRTLAGEFATAMEASELLHRLRAPQVDAAVSEALADEAPSEVLRPQEVGRLKDILMTYPGSPRWGNVETRGLDSDFARDTYVETELDRRLYEAVSTGSVGLVVLCGNAGDGKTSILQHLAKGLGISGATSSKRVWEATLSDGLMVQANLDGAASWNGRSADDLLDELFEPFQNGDPGRKIVHLVAVNDGRLLEWIAKYEGRIGSPTALTTALAGALSDEDAEIPAHIRFINLNVRSLVGTASGSSDSSEFINELLDRMVGGANAAQVWQPCLNCSAQDRCAAWRSARALARLDKAASEQSERIRKRLVRIFRAVHQRNEVHITARALKAALSYVLFGVHYCTDLHADPALVPPTPYDLAFNEGSIARQGDLLSELARLDPGLGASPRTDRYLLSRARPDSTHRAPRFPNLRLASARRRAFFEYSDEQIKAMGDGDAALDLARGAHLQKFLTFPLKEVAEQRTIQAELCLGISRLENLPRVALERSVQADIVPIAIIPRTPTETVLWVEKPLSDFGLKVEPVRVQPGIESLHRKLVLSYRTKAGGVERLDIPFELFALLMDLKDGVQLSDVASDEVFANLAVFTERLAREDDTRVLAWNPLREETTFEVAIRHDNGHQVLVLEQIQGR